MTAMAQATQTTRELELQLTLWRERLGAAQLKAQLIQAQTSLLQVEGRDCQAELSRIEALLSERKDVEAKVALEQQPIAAAAD